MRSGRYFISYQNGLKVIKDNQLITLDTVSGVAVLEMENFDFQNPKDIIYLSTSPYQKADFLKVAGTPPPAPIAQPVYPWVLPSPPVNRLYQCIGSFGDGFGNDLLTIGKPNLLYDGVLCESLEKCIAFAPDGIKWKLTAELKFERYSGIQEIVNLGSCYGVNLNVAFKLAGVGTGVCGTKVNLVEDGWNIVEFVRDGDNMYCYINGINIGAFGGVLLIKFAGSGYNGGGNSIVNFTKKTWRNVQFIKG